MDYQTTNADRWYRYCPGTVVLDQEREQLAKLLTHIFGDFLVQIGGPSDLSLVQASPIKKKIYLGPNTSSHQSEQIQANCLELPLIPGSVDLMVLAHSLEFVKNPGAVLQQVHQALVPSGRVIILGFNAWSLWGLQRCFSKQKDFPWHGKFRSIAKIKRSLYAVGLQTVISKTLFFRPALQDRDALRRCLYFEPIGQFCFPWFGGIYMITAEKRAPILTPAKASWSLKKVTVPNGCAEPTARVHKLK